MSGFDFDLVTIGAGSGGVRASRMAARLGKRVAVAEESRVGGTCVMRGCVPKKLLVMGAHMAEDIADAAGFGWDVGEVSFDWGRLVSAKNVELNRLEGVYNRILRDSGVTVLEGRGTVVDAHTVEVAGKRYSAENILIATGGRPSLPKIPASSTPSPRTRPWTCCNCPNPWSSSAAAISRWNSPVFSMHWASR